MIRVITGNNWYAIKSALNAEINNFLSNNNELLIEKFYGPEVEYSQILSSLRSVSLFSDKKLLIVEKLSFHKQASENINELLSMVDDSITFVIVESNIDKRSSYYKTLKKLENFTEFNELDEKSLVRWVGDFVKEENGQISDNDSLYLVSRIGLNQTNLEMELIKLLAYDKKISKSSIDLLTEQTPTSTIFSLVEAAFNGNLEYSMKLYEEQRSMKVEPQAIFGMLVWQMHLVAICSTTTKTAFEISKDTGLSNFVLGKSKSIADKMGKTKVEEYLDFLAEIEETSRNQTYNFDDAMKLAIAKLSI